jgi:hypothetical protein
MKKLTVTLTVILASMLNAAPAFAAGENLASELAGVRDTAVGTIRSIYRNWQDTGCGTLMDEHRELFRNTKIQVFFNEPNQLPSGELVTLEPKLASGVKVGLKLHTSVRNGARELRFIVDRETFAKQASTESVDHGMAAYVASQMLSTEGTDDGVRNCVIDYLKERDRISVAAPQLPGAPAARALAGSARR